MSKRFRNNLVSQTVIVLGVCFFLTACDMPEKPEGEEVEGLTRIGNQLQGRGDDMGAADFYQRSLQRNPADTGARKGLAEILEIHGDNAGAANQYREALRADPDNAEFLRALGRILLKQGKAQEAKVQYERALQIDSGDVKALNGLGISLDYLTDHSAAQKVYKEALDHQPDDLVTLNNLAHSYVLSGGYQDAIQLLEPHAQDKKATPALRQNLAEAYAMVGMDADAERLSRMDLTPEQVKHNLDYYRERRAKLALVPKFNADLGSFATEALAQMRAQDIKAKFSQETEALIITTTPEVKTIGSTPVFTVQVSGFSRAEHLRSFCDKLKKSGYPCKADVGG